MRHGHTSSPSLAVEITPLAFPSTPCSIFPMAIPASSSSSQRRSHEPKTSPLTPSWHPPPLRHRGRVPSSSTQASTSFLSLSVDSRTTPLSHFSHAGRAKAPRCIPTFHGPCHTHLHSGRVQPGQAYGLLHILPWLMSANPFRSSTLGAPPLPASSAMSFSSRNLPGAILLLRHAPSSSAVNPWPCIIPHG